MSEIPPNSSSIPPANGIIDPPSILAILGDHHLALITTIFLQLISTTQASVGESVISSSPKEGKKPAPSQFTPISTQIAEGLIETHIWIATVLQELQIVLSQDSFLLSREQESAAALKKLDQPTEKELFVETSTKNTVENEVSSPRHTPLFFPAVPGKTINKTGEHPAFASLAQSEAPQNISKLLTINVSLIKAFKDLTKLSFLESSFSETFSSHASKTPLHTRSLSLLIEAVKLSQTIPNIRENVLDEPKLKKALEERVFSAEASKSEKMLPTQKNLPRAEKGTLDLETIAPKVLAKTLAKFLQSESAPMPTLVGKEEGKMFQPLPFSPKFALRRKKDVQKKTPREETDQHRDEDCLEEESS
ncbi:MAG: hypothetical protein AAGI90_01155 [Chlamydiota bacterium]